MIYCFNLFSYSFFTNYCRYYCPVVVVAAVVVVVVVLGAD